MKFDLHIHSHRSPDSFSRIDSILGYAKKRGLSGIALTDHGMIAPDGLESIARDNGLWIIRGNEIQTEIGDVLALFLSRPVESRSAESLISEIHDQGGVAVLAHPFKYAQAYPLRIVEKFDAIETVNGRWKDLSLLEDNPKVTQLLSLVRGRCAGSDAHFAPEVGRAYWETESLASPEDLKRTIRTGSGQAVCSRYSPWLDEASQGVKFLKQPSARQLARVMYWTMRRLTFTPRSGL